MAELDLQQLPVYVNLGLKLCIVGISWRPIANKQDPVVEHIFAWHEIAHLFKTNSSKQANQLCLDQNPHTEYYLDPTYASFWLPQAMVEGITWIKTCRTIQKWFGSTSVFSGSGKARSQAAEASWIQIMMALW